VGAGVVVGVDWVPGDTVVVGAAVVGAAVVTSPDMFGVCADAGSTPASWKLVTTGTATAAPVTTRRRKTRRCSGTSPNVGLSDMKAAPVS
jgi:hypothetical protein